MLELEAFGEPCIAVDWRERQKGDVDFLFISQLGNIMPSSVVLEGAIVLW